jgi:serine/threonine-protein kinase
VSETRNIGKYEILRLLGEGGAGQVHSARDTLLHREVAIKSLRPELISDQNFVDRFMTEAKNLGRLNHPNITTLYDLIFEGASLYMVMELVTGRTVERLLLDRSGQLPLGEAQAIISQVGDGLQYAHGLGIIHRDIKPANLMISDAGLVKIMDFGIARARGSQRLTRDGKIIGSLAYMAPEQVRGEEGNERSDIYSLAIVLYELLSGHAPFSAPTDFDLMQAQINQAPERISARIGGLPASVENAILKALSKNPDKRYPSVAAFCEAVGATTGNKEAVRLVVQASTRVIDSGDATTAQTRVASQSSAAKDFFGKIIQRVKNAPPMVVGGVIGGLPAAVLALLILSPGTPPSSSPTPKLAELPASSSKGPGNAPSVSADAVVAAYDRGDYSVAFALSQRADLSDPKVLYILGKCYDTGHGTNADPFKAERYLQMAADRGHPDAALRLAYDYGHGFFGSPNKEKAREIYEKLARDGNPLAIFNTGRIYDEKGDKDRAAKWYRRLSNTMVSGGEEMKAKAQAEQRLQVLEPSLHESTLR